MALRPCHTSERPRCFNRVEGNHCCFIYRLFPIWYFVARFELSYYMIPVCIFTISLPTRDRIFLYRGPPLCYCISIKYCCTLSSSEIPQLVDPPPHRGTNIKSALLENRVSAVLQGSTLVQQCYTILYQVIIIVQTNDEQCVDQAHRSVLPRQATATTFAVCDSFVRS